MKLYNITNSGKLFQVLSQCRGNVEAVDENGQHMTLFRSEEKNDINELFRSYLKGSIKELELSFEKSQDVARVCRYLCEMDNAA